MARNKFDVDERLESPFRWKHLKRAGKYIARHKYKMIAALLLSALASVASLFIPACILQAADQSQPFQVLVCILAESSLGAFHPGDQSLFLIIAQCMGGQSCLFAYVLN